jgi:hypothetical protein
LNEKLDDCDEVRSGEAVCLDERRTTSNLPPQTTSSEHEGLAAMPREMLLRRGTTSQREAGKSTQTEALVEQTPNA